PPDRAAKIPSVCAEVPMIVGEQDGADEQAPRAIAECGGALVLEKLWFNRTNATGHGFLSSCLRERSGWRLRRAFNALYRSAMASRETRRPLQAFGRG